MTRLFKNAMLAIALLCSISMALGSAIVAAQSANDVDIEEVGNLVFDADPDVLLEDLQTPMRNRDLPDGFSDATLIDPDDPDAAVGLLDTADYGDVLGSVGYTYTGDTEVLGGVTAIVTSQILLLDPDVDAADSLDDIISGAEDELGTVDSADADITVEKSTLNDVDVAVIVYSQTVKRASVLVTYQIVPVGNAYVITSVTIGDKTEVDTESVQEFNDELALSVITYLGDIAADAS